MPKVQCGFSDGPGGVQGRLLLAGQGPTMLVDIGFDPGYNPKVPGKPVSGIQGVKALVDTGAGESYIDSALAAQLRLPIVDRRPVSGALGSDMVNMHLAQVHLPDLETTIYGAFGGVHLAAGGQIHQALIGRTFLLHVHMVYDGHTGQVIITKQGIATAPPIP